ncbi:uncharacterized protein LOC135203907 [Macrobrachium nipponense]|uniref:uncharacterized protein LOC135203907 n=1 Tax=Macrobrachium nipponense TaxID=159736 RepID=UPI0030C7DA67
MNLNEQITFQIDALEDALPVKRKKKIKMADELASDKGSSSDPLVGFRINVFNLIMDRIVQSLESRFVQHKQLYKDLSCLDSTNFKTIAEKGLKDGALRGIIKLFPQIIRDQVKLELFFFLSFSSNFDVLKLLLHDGENVGSSCTNSKMYTTCPSCILKILASNRRHDKAYDNLYELYKIICTLSVTQVKCERAFSKLKIIKTRLRNSMSEENLESYMLLSIEKEMLDELDNEVIISIFAQSSSEL